jgi:hypothetical protein
MSANEFSSAIDDALVQRDSLARLFSASIGEDELAVKAAMLGTAMYVCSSGELRPCGGAAVAWAHLLFAAALAPPELLARPWLDRVWDQGLGRPE